MSIFESLIDASEDGVDSSKKYVTTSYKYTKLKIFQLLTHSISIIVKLFLIGSLVLVGGIFLAVAAAIAIGDFYNNPYLGYLVIGGSLFLFSLLLYLFRGVIDKKIIKKLSSQFFDSGK